MVDGLSARCARGFLGYAVVAATAAFWTIGSAASRLATPIGDSCVPQLWTGTVHVGPDLAVRARSTGDGGCPTIRVLASGAGGAVWGADWSDGLWRSTDGLRHWTLAYRADGYASVERVLQLPSGYVLLVVADAAGRRYVLRSLDTAGRRFGAPVFAFPRGTNAGVEAPRLLGSQSWFAVGQTVYMGEYCDLEKDVYLWRSTNDGRSFNVVSTFTDIRHIHSVYPDPYVRGRIWVTIGDNGQQSRIGYSDDGGQTLQEITQGIPGQSRAVGLMFAPDAVFWSTDSPELPAVLYRWDRSSQIITTVLGGLNGPYYFTASYRGAFADFSTVNSKLRDHYVGDAWIHVLTSDDNGATWSYTRTPWSVSDAALAADDKAQIAGITSPDASGNFWVSYQNLAGSATQITNLDLQLEPRLCRVRFNLRCPAVAAREGARQ